MPTSFEHENILLYGLDPVLLNTRRMLLEHAGFKVEITQDREDFQGRTAKVSYDLLIVCHTVPQIKQQLIASMENSQRPHILQMPILLLPHTFLKQVQQQLR